MIVQINSLKDIKEKDYILFKHSLTCPISANAKTKVDTFITSHPKVPVYMCVVQGHEDLKWAIADEYEITHESPQAIIVRDGKVVATENHYGIQQLEKFFD